jgi:hypothetical protein
MHLVKCLPPELLTLSLSCCTAGELAAAQAALAKGSALGPTPASQAAASAAATTTAAAGMPPAGSAAGIGSAAVGAESLWTLADITARPEEFRKGLIRGVLAHKCVELRAVLMLEAPADAAHMTVGEAAAAAC